MDTIEIPALIAVRSIADIGAAAQDAEDFLFEELCVSFANLRIPWCEIRTRPSKLKMQDRCLQPATKQRFVEQRKNEDVNVVAKSKWRSRRSPLMECSRQPRHSRLQLKPTNKVDSSVEMDAETALWEKKLVEQRAWIEAMPNLDELPIRRASRTVSLPMVISEASVPKINVARVVSTCSKKKFQSAREKISKCHAWPWWSPQKQ